MSGPEHRHDDDRTGNGIVNHGPESTANTDPVQDGEQEQDNGSGDGSGDGAEGAPGAPGDPGAPGATGTPGAPSAPGGTVVGAGHTAAAAEGGEEAAEAAERAAVSEPSAGLPGPGAGDGAPGIEGGTLTALFQGGAGAGADGTPGGNEHPDEVALRRMLRGAVQGIEPGDGTLEHLQRAVPARRARRRQGVVGAAAAALLIGTAVPAFVHVANSDGSAAANPAIAGHGQQAQGGSGDDAGAEATGERTTGPADRASEGGEDAAGGSAAPSQDAGSRTEGSGTGGVDDDPDPEAADMPACDPGQLGVVSAELQTAEADGTVYGSFRIANVSGKVCSVNSNGTVGVRTTGAADRQKITVVQHTAGDPAAGLPDPSLEPGTVLLQPAMAYEVRFAWVPSDTCPTTGGTPSPEPTAGDGSGGTGGGEADGGAAAGSTDTAPQFGSADEGPADGSVAVTHTPEAGAPTAETTITHACSGTIYRTGVLPPS
ncbi:hypothetical protein ABZ371_12290 [Streptomyces sp. NPDC005899]|uniref:hypothetical protein n=1 Tax=Streptomyces sp. NPDC005899 TaxID=3155716 RepID=UPI0033CEA381